MKQYDQYFWNIFFSLIFTGMVGMMMWCLSEWGSYRRISVLSFLELLVVTLATWRLVRLFVYDKITAFLREAPLVEENGQLVKPESGVRRTIADLLSCPWCFGVWAAAAVLFFYLKTPLADFPIYFLAIGAVATWLQIFTNLVGHSAEYQKNRNQK